MIGYIALKNRGATIVYQLQLIGYHFNKLNVMTDKNDTALILLSA